MVPRPANGWLARRPPCLDWLLPLPALSQAGKRKGLDDERHLWPAWSWLIDQCRPDTIFGEQVASPAGRAWLDLVFSDLEAIGYACGAVVFPAAGVGAPQQRHRTYWVARPAAARDYFAHWDQSLSHEEIQGHGMPNLDDSASWQAIQGRRRRMVGGVACRRGRGTRACRSRKWWRWRVGSRRQLEEAGGTCRAVSGAQGSGESERRRAGGLADEPSLQATLAPWAAAAARDWRSDRSQLSSEDLYGSKVLPSWILQWIVAQTEFLS